MAHSDIDSDQQPPRRVGAQVLLLTVDGTAVALVKPTYKHQDDTRGWQLPGGCTHAGELVSAAAARELMEETSLVRVLTHVVVIDQVPAEEDGSSGEGYNVVFTADRLTAEEAGGLAVPEAAADELPAIRLVPLDDLDEYAFPYQAARIRAAVETEQRGNEIPVLAVGKPVRG